MCTVTWLRTADGYALFSNRDEKKTRRAATPPATMVCDGVRYCAPIDGDHGGTWIAVNEFGLSLCLLNRYQDEPVAPSLPFTSRGEIICSLIPSRTTGEILQKIRRKPLTSYQPFTLLALSRHEKALKVEWNGRALVINPDADPTVPLVSSSVDTPGAFEKRYRVFRELTRHGATNDALVRFHHSHDPAPGPYSPCMHREDAVTVSFTTVTVDGGGITMQYVPSAPCEGRPGTISRIAVLSRAA